jgi:cytochrome c-type biogenesis protein CcmE
VSDIDEKGEDTAQDPSAEPQVVPVGPGARRRPSQDGEPVSVKKGLFIVIPLVMVGAAIIGLVLSGMEDNGIYSKPVDQLVKEKAKFAGRPVRAEGTLVHGTLVKRDSPCEYKFTIESQGTEVPVSFKQCVVPDTFRDVPDMPVSVTVEGQLLADNHFEATKVVAKCPSKYEMQERAKKGEKMPHTAPTDQQQM